MQIDWNAFTPGSALVGGLLLGLAAVMFAALNGRILGVSGIIGGLLNPRAGDIRWRVATIVGIAAAPWLYGMFAALPPITIAAGTPTIVVAGLLVGIGTRYGAGCTSGHGVCGLSRLSLRSLIATLAFMAAGFAIVFVVRHLLGT